MKTIPLTQGLVALVDDEDYESVNAFNWFAARRGRVVYAARNLRKPDGTWTQQFIHQLLFSEAKSIDHRDGDGRNNQRENLRVATKMQNAQAFQRKKAGTSSSYRGVHWDTERRKWSVEIKLNRKKIFLGRFEDEVFAAKTYDCAAREYFGDFASPNFP